MMDGASMVSNLGKCVVFVGFYSAIDVDEAVGAAGQERPS